MSNLREVDFDPNDPLYYAPRHTRFARHDNPEPIRDLNTEPLLPADELLWREAAQDPPPLRQRSQAFEDAVSRALQESREPQEVYTPTMANRRRGVRGFGVAARYGLALAAAALVALFIHAVVPMIGSTPSKVDIVAEGNSLWHQLKSQFVPSPPRKASASTLAFADQSGDRNDTLPVGVSVNAAPPGATVILSGLPAGSRITNGRKISGNDWRIAAQDLVVAAVTPPTDFVGQVTVGAELRNADGAALVGGSFRMVWSGPAAQVASLAPPRAAAPVVAQPQMAVPQVAAPVAVAPVRAPVVQPTISAPPDRSMDPNEIAALIKRAQEFAAVGDIAPARLMLRRAAEGHSTQAAMLLAESYDPILLKQTASGPLPDIVMARKWYGKAAEWGVPEASRRLNALQAF